MNQITASDRRRLAAEVGVSEQYLYQCLSGIRDMNPGKARRIESETNGVLHRRLLCQKTWQEIWPELDAVPVAANDAGPEAATAQG